MTTKILNQFNLNYLFSFAFLLFLSTCGTQRTAPPPPVEEVILSDRLNRIKMTDLDGRPFTLQKLAGRPVFLNFWATWCGPCVSEMGSIEALFQEMGSEVVFLAVSNESIEKIENFRKKHLFKFQLARLDVDYLDAFVTKLPTTLLINAQGEIIYDEEGSRIWTSINNKDKVKELVR